MKDCLGWCFPSSFRMRSPFLGLSLYWTLSRLKEFLGTSIWHRIAAPPPLFNAGTRVLHISWWRVRAPPPHPPRPTPTVGCFSVEVGSPPPRSVSVGTMVEAGDIATHQHLGDESPVPSTTGFPGHNRQPAGDSKVRQLHGSCLYQQTKGDNVGLPLRVDRATSPMDGSPHRAPGNQVPPGTIEHPSGPPQPPEPNAGCRVVSPPAGSMEYHPYMGVADDRPVRDTPQCEATPILLPHPRSTSRLRERLPQHVVHPRRESSGRSQRDPKSLHDPGLPPQAREGVVLPPPPADPTTPGTASAGSPPEATPL